MKWELSLREAKSYGANVLLAVSTSQEYVHPEPGTLAENSTYWWLLKGDFASPFTVQLNVNGVQLSRDIASPTEIWFRWDIGFQAGFADIELKGVDTRIWTSRVEVDPVVSKLVRQDFRLMLRDIIADTRSLASTSGLRVPVSKGKHELPIATLEFILETLPRLQKLIAELNSASRGRLRRSQRSVPLRDARRLTSQQLNSSRRSATVVDRELIQRLPPALRDLVSQNGGILPHRVPQTRSEVTSSRREHSEILGLLTSLKGQLSRALRALAAADPEQGNSGLQDRCLRGRRQIDVLQSFGVFSGLTPALGQWNHSHLYQRVEPYRSLYRIYRDVQSGVSGVDGDFASVPLQETYRLYETWVALRLARAAGTLDSGLDASSMFIDDPSKGKLTLSLNSTAVEFKGHTLRFKPVFEEVWRTQDGIGSYSRRMIPDVVLEFPGPKGLKNFLILDAKYRVEAQLNEAIVSLHMYKDALIQENRSSPTIGERDRALVVSGYVIVPAAPSGMNGDTNWRTEKMPTVLFRQGYRDRFNLGAMLLRPGMNLSEVGSALAGMAAYSIQTNQLSHNQVP
ncbi:DUF2357 domain-containing protein [Pseudarthrobacter quantipunctorum]|uniref:DUF2357 domain-containing protein n=1 Tax=Pseudarthrobacter quantipunctorum TaxID=3128980 RepID=A0ABZ2R487_9MICC